MLCLIQIKADVCAYVCRYVCNFSGVRYSSQRSGTEIGHGKGYGQEGRNFNAP